MLPLFLVEAYIWVFAHDSSDTPKFHCGTKVVDFPAHCSTVYTLPTFLDSEQIQTHSIITYKRNPET